MEGASSLVTTENTPCKLRCGQHVKVKSLYLKLPSVRPAGWERYVARVSAGQRVAVSAREDSGGAQVVTQRVPLTECLPVGHPCATGVLTDHDKCVWNTQL